MEAKTVPEVQAVLRRLAEEEYRRFSSSLLPGVPCEILGVRLPRLRRLAADLAKGPWREYLAWAEATPALAFEERMLQGMVIGAAPLSLTDALAHTRRFVPKINNWSVCDSFCAGLSIARKAPDAVWDFLRPYLKSAAAFEARFGLVMLLDYYVDPLHLEGIFSSVISLQSSGYYAQMAAAWLLSVCYVKFPEQTEPFLQNAPLDPWILQKTLQKIVESKRISNETREKIRRWKREAAGK